MRFILTLRSFQDRQLDSLGLECAALVDKLIFLLFLLLQENLQSFLMEPAPIAWISKHIFASTTLHLLSHHWASMSITQLLQDLDHMLSK